MKFKTKVTSYLLGLTFLIDPAGFETMALIAQSRTLPIGPASHFHQALTEIIAPQVQPVMFARYMRLFGAMSLETGDNFFILMGSKFDDKGEFTGVSLHYLVDEAGFKNSPKSVYGDSAELAHFPSIRISPMDIGRKSGELREWGFIGGDQAFFDHQGQKYLLHDGNILEISDEMQWRLVQPAPQDVAAMDLKRKSIQTWMQPIGSNEAYHSIDEILHQATLLNAAWLEEAMSNNPPPSNSGGCDNLLH